MNFIIKSSFLILELIYGNHLNKRGLIKIRVIANDKKLFGKLALTIKEVKYFSDNLMYKFENKKGWYNAEDFEIIEED